MAAPQVESISIVSNDICVLDPSLEGNWNVTMTGVSHIKHIQITK